MIEAYSNIHRIHHTKKTHPVHQPIIIIIYLAVLSAPHLQFFHCTNIIQFNQSIHRSRSQPVAVGIPRDAVHLLLVAADGIVVDSGVATTDTKKAERRKQGTESKKLGQC